MAQFFSLIRTCAMVGVKDAVLPTSAPLKPHGGRDTGGSVQNNGGGGEEDISALSSSLGPLFYRMFLDCSTTQSSSLWTYGVYVFIPQHASECCMFCWFERNCLFAKARMASVGTLSMVNLRQ